MPFFVYGTDPETGEVRSRFFAEAATEAEARELAERQGMRVTEVVHSRATSAIVLPEVPPPAPTDAEVERDETAAFDRTLNAITPRVRVTYALVGANVLVFVLMALFGVDVLHPGSTDLLRWGAEYGPRSTNGESWRLLSSLFVHIGILHLGYNMIALLYVAPTVERMLGHSGFLLTYLIGGIAGGLCALFWNPMQLHAGSSGAIFGIYGALLALLLRDRATIPPHVRARLRNFVLVFIAYNLINSLRPEVSLAAHVGGIVGGLLCGLALAGGFAQPASAGRLARRGALAATAIALFVGGVTIAQARYPNIGPIVALLERSSDTMGKFNRARKQHSDKQLSDVDFAALIERELLPDWQAERAALAQVAPVPPSLHENIDALVAYFLLRQQHWEALVKALRETKGRDWLHTPARRENTPEFQRAVDVRGAYIEAVVDLQFAKPDAADRNHVLQRVQQLAARLQTLEDRDRAANMRLAFDDYSAMLERDQLPELRSIEQAFAELPATSGELQSIVTALRAHLRYKQDEWEPRVAYLHYAQCQKDADDKGARARDAARAIRDAPGTRLLAPY